MKNLNSLIGQPLALSQAKGLFNYSILGGPITDPIQPRLVFGPSGAGKSKLLSLLKKDCEDKKMHCFQVDDCDTIALQSGQNTADLIEALNASQLAPTLVILDEAQKIFKGSKTKSAMERDLCTLIFPHGERIQDRITTRINGEEVTADFRNLILILATNEKEAMETSQSKQKGEFPFARRFSTIELTTYSQKDMETIIPAYFAANGYKIGDCAAGMVSRLHRGTMSALCDVMKRVKESVFKAVVSKDDVIKACRLTDYLPRGLKKGEARLLDAATRNVIPSSRGQVISGHFGKLYQASLNHLLEQWADKKDGERVSSPLISVIGGSRIVTTPFGEKFLASIAKDGFTW